MLSILQMKEPWQSEAYEVHKEKAQNQITAV
jgi:hypothetical protein